ncbi:benzoate/H(+) symporter BenE family transporter [Labrys neptuniae]
MGSGAVARQFAQPADGGFVPGVSAGLAYLLFGSFAAGFVALFEALPEGLVPALAGLALIGSVTSSLSAALAEADEREAALVTFAVTVSGVTFFGLSAAFWGLVAGLLLRHQGLLKARFAR